VRRLIPMSPSTVASAWSVLSAGLALAMAAGIIVLAFIARSLSRSLREMASSVERFGEGDLSAEAPEGGPRELAGLGRSLNRMRGELAARIGAMERERGTLDAILASLGEGVVLFAPDGAALYMNPSAEGLLGGPIEHARNLTPASLQAMVIDATGGTSPTSEELVSGHASPRTLLATAVPMRAEGSVLLVLRDVTEARRVETIRRDFVANASHELKTPAASIQALAETIVSASGDDPRAVKRFAGQLEQEAARMARMVSDLLDLSRLEGEPAKRTELRLDRLVVEEAESHRGQAEDAGLSLALDCDEQLLVNGSARDLRLMVRNLVENAIQYTRPGGRIEVSARADGDHALLGVRDTGVGIPAKDQPRVFERFYRVDRARSRKTGGTGLGLSIVKHVVETHGGTVSVESALGEGSRFIVRLPLAG
jgi:two-component system, OmpR family, phosphate regulon sensor histidine kinase PhoR